MGEIARIKSKSEELCIAGDLNAHVGTVVHGNHEKVSTRGKLILELLETGDFTLVNSLDVVVNGPFTRYDVKDSNNEDKKSLLDYIIVSTNLVKYIEKLEVDANLNGTANRNHKGILKFPDHYAVMMTLKNIPMKKTMSVPPRKEIVWNTRKKNGWIKYREKTENNPVFLKAATMEDENEEAVLKMIEKELTSIKFACFGKVKLTSKDKSVKNLEALQEEKLHKISNKDSVDGANKIKELDENIANALKQIEKERLEKDIKALENLKHNKGRSAAVFGLRDKVLGKKKVAPEQMILRILKQKRQ